VAAGRERGLCNGFIETIRDNIWVSKLGVTQVSFAANANSRVNQIDAALRIGNWELKIFNLQFSIPA
jgi:hypothetical protein